MLDPEDRQLVRALLQPPAGFKFDRAVATTFSLDLMTLLTMPVAFTMFERAGIENNGKIDPLALLQALRQHSGQIHVFCQAGRIAVPKRHQLLFAELERSVIEVAPPSEHGVFHPKVTILRFVGDLDPLPQGHPDAEMYEPNVWYRVVCSSRNLTFDRSWDTAVVLEGEVAPRKRRKHARNRPLAEFVRRLPELAIQPGDSSKSQPIHDVADELERVDFELPAGFDELAFCPLGLEESSSQPFVRDMDRLLIVSPFVSQELLDSFDVQDGRCVLVSRSEAMNELAAPTLERFETYILESSTEEPGQELNESGPAGEEDELEINTDAENGEVSSSGLLSGLHAKVFVADCGRTTHVWTGSANATNAAFRHNIEFMIELRGPKSRHGIHRLVRSPDGHDDDNDTRTLRFDDLLVPYTPPAELEPPSEDERLAEHLAEQARRHVSRAGLTAHVEPCASAEDQYDLALHHGSSRDDLSSPENVSVTCRPMSLQPHAFTALKVNHAEPAATFSSLSFKAITPFFVFRIEAKSGRVKHRLSFVLNLPLHGAPDDRPQRLLGAMLENREQLLRYLLMMLAEDEHNLRTLTESLTQNGNSNGMQTGNSCGMPLLEPLLRTLEQEPERLDQLARVIEDLERNEQSRALLPDDFLAAWEAIWAARQEMQS